MLQALTTLVFLTLALLASATMFFLLRNDWDAVRTALGFERRVYRPVTGTPHVRVKSARRALMVRMEAPRRRAAA